MYIKNKKSDILCQTKSNENKYKMGIKKTN